MKQEENVLLVDFAKVREMLIKSNLIKQPLIDMMLYELPIADSKLEGEWIKDDNSYSTEPMVCSRCKKVALNLGYRFKLSKYCPHCGTKMKNGRD